MGKPQQFTTKIQSCFHQVSAVSCESYLTTIAKTLCLQGNFACFLSTADFFQNHIFFLKNYFMNTIRVSNILDPYQAQRFVRPDLGPNLLGLILVQTVCKGYEQTTKLPLAWKELSPILLSADNLCQQFRLR